MWQVTRRNETQNRERFDVDYRAKQRTNLEKIEQKESQRVLTVWRESLVKQGDSRQGVDTAYRHHRDSRAEEKKSVAFDANAMHDDEK